MSDVASAAMNQLEVVALARLARTVLEKQEGDVDVPALAHLCQATDCLEATMAGERGLTDLKH